MSASIQCQPVVDSKPRVETVPYLGAVRRMIRAAGRRAGAGDEIELRALLELRSAVEEAIGDAARAQVAGGRSWAFVAEGLGVSRQAAFKRYARVGDREVSL